MKTALVVTILYVAFATSCIAQAQPEPDPCRNAGIDSDQAAILSDTMGVDFSPYVARIKPIVHRNWYTLISAFVDVSALKQGKVSIEFLILKDGHVDLSSIRIETSSGDVALDRAARGSIIRSDPLPPLPAEFSGPSVRLRFHFYYNLSPHISISPCTDVRVPAGSTVQFSASGKGITNTSVTWSVFGPGCSKLTCGTISDNGLYTAPSDIPNPPTVVVMAKSRAVSLPAQTRLTVVLANPH